MLYKNPIIPGFNPDPSICRVGNDYYCVTSSFEYFPGIPIYHSTDLVHWEQIGHCLTRESQVDLTGIIASDGIWAPTIRFSNGLFYVACVTVRRSPQWSPKNFYVTATDPKGPWSEPVWLDNDGIDPDLFFDEDGRCYFLRNGGRGIYIRELDTYTGKLITEEKHLWTGTGGAFPEAPHLYKVKGTYFLIIAEGGTGREHMITVARSKDVNGPYETCPHNPILSHYFRELNPIQSTGHGDIVEDHLGNWWIVFLGTRPVFDKKEQFQHLGRETFLAPLTWHQDNWPVVNEGNGVELIMDAPLPSWRPLSPISQRDDFDKQELHLTWNYLRNPDLSSVSLTKRKGWVTLAGSPVGLDQIGSPTFIGRRQQHFDCEIRTLVEFNAVAENEQAGITVRMNEDYHYDLYKTVLNGSPCLTLRSKCGEVLSIVSQLQIPEDPIILGVRTTSTEYTFLMNTLLGSEKIIGTLPVRPLSQQITDGFTGVYFGIFSSGNGTSCANSAYFDWFDYIPVE